MALTGVLAGCASDEDGSDDEYQNADENGSNETESDDGGSEEFDEEEVQNREEGEDVLEFGDLEVLEHDLVVEEGEFSDEITVEGVIENAGDEAFDYVEVGVRVYNPDGHQLDRYMTNTEDLDGGQTWAFEIMVLEDAEDVEEYDIGVSGSRY